MLRGQHRGHGLLLDTHEDYRSLGCYPMGAKFVMLTEEEYATLEARKPAPDFAAMSPDELRVWLDERGRLHEGRATGEEVLFHAWFGGGGTVGAGSGSTREAALLALCQAVAAKEALAALTAAKPKHEAPLEALAAAAPKRKEPDEMTDGECDGELLDARAAGYQYLVYCDTCPVDGAYHEYILTHNGHRVKRGSGPGHDTHGATRAAVRALRENVAAKEAS